MAEPGRLSQRALNRATLDRQLLLRRHDLPALQALQHLAGLQGQAPLAPYVGLWTRLSGFTPQELANLYSERAVVRAPIMRATVHLVDAADYVAFRALFSPLLAGILRTNFARKLPGVDLEALAAQAAELIALRPHTRAELARTLAPRWPDADPLSLAYAATSLVPALQVPPRGIWGKSAQATWACAQSWLGVPLDPANAPSATISSSSSSSSAASAAASAASTSTSSAAASPVERLVLRYLAAFGPATVADAQTWSGLTRLREVTHRLELRTLRGPDGAELLDLPGIALPDEDVPAPPRFLPEFDNLLLSHADRRRVIPVDRPVPLWTGNGGTQGTLLIDGVWDAVWKIAGQVLTVTPFRRLTADEKSAIAGEGARLLAFTCPDAASPDIRFT